MADFPGHRFGRVAAVLKRDENGYRQYRIRWDDGTYETRLAHQFMTRYTVESPAYRKVLGS